VNTLVQKTTERGCHTIAWNGLDGNGNTTPAGMYFSRMSVNGSLVNTTKLVKIR
jgi:flagellar hook assembly protein FlgD